MVMLKLVCVQWQVSQDQVPGWEADQRTPQREGEAFHRKSWAYADKFMLCLVTSVTFFLQLRYPGPEYKTIIIVRTTKNLIEHWRSPVVRVRVVPYCFINQYMLFAILFSKVYLKLL